MKYKIQLVLSSPRSLRLFEPPNVAHVSRSRAPAASSAPTLLAQMEGCMPQVRRTMSNEFLQGWTSFQCWLKVAVESQRINEFTVDGEFGWIWGIGAIVIMILYILLPPHWEQHEANNSCVCRGSSRLGATPILYTTWRHGSRSLWEHMPSSYW